MDSGADVSVLQLQLLNRLDSSSVINWDKESGPRKCVSASGHDLGPAGKATIKFKIGTRPFVHTFVVVRNLQQQLILGDDFLSEKSALVDFQRRVMKIAGEDVKLSPRDQDEDKGTTCSISRRDRKRSYGKGTSPKAGIKRNRRTGRSYTWTSDGRPICFACNVPGHMGRECHQSKKSNKKPQSPPRKEDLQACRIFSAA